MPLVALVGAIGCGTAEAPDAPPPLDQVRAHAADLGLGWLTRNSDAIPPDMRLPFFYRLSNVVTDGPWAEPVRRELERALQLPLIRLEPEIARLQSPPQPQRLSRILNELWRRQLIGRPANAAREAVRRWLAANQATWWSEMPLSRQLIFLRRFERAGLAPARTFDAILADLREAVRRAGERAAIEHSNLMFAQTHAVLTQSDDFSRHVDAGELRPELELMRRAAAYYLDFEPPPSFAGMLDLRAQLVTCQELARLPLGPVEERTLRWVAGRQRPDGSFEGDAADERGRAHATLVATRSMLPLDRPFGPELDRDVAAGARGPGATGGASWIEGRVVSVRDGDTFEMQTADGIRRIRLAGIDTPERGQPWAERSKRALEARVAGKPVRVNDVATDRYDRTVGEVYADDVCVGCELVRDGHAWAYRRYLDPEDPEDAVLLELEAQARRERRGLWALPDSERVPPWQWRRSHPRNGDPGPRNGDPGRARDRDPDLAARRDDARRGECGRKRYCDEMTSCEEARFHLEHCGLDTIDGDGDGVPCERLCQPGEGAGGP